MKASLPILFLLLLLEAACTHYVKDLDPNGAYSLDTLTRLSGSLSPVQFESLITANQTLALSLISHVNASANTRLFASLIERLALSKFSCPTLDERIFKNLSESHLRTYMGTALQAPRNVSTCIVSLVENSLRVRMTYKWHDSINPWPAITLFQANATSPSSDLFIQLLLAYGRPSMRRLYYRYLPFRIWTQLNLESQMTIFFEARGQHYDRLYERMTSLHIANIFHTLATSDAFARKRLLGSFVQSVLYANSSSSAIAVDSIGRLVTKPNEGGSALDMYTPSVIALLWYEPGLITVLESLHPYFAPLSGERFYALKDASIKMKAFLDPHILHPSIYDTISSSELLSILAHLMTGKWKSALLRFIENRNLTCTLALQSQLLASDRLTPLEAYMKLESMCEVTKPLSVSSQDMQIRNLLSLVGPLLHQPSLEEMSQYYDEMTLFLNYWRLKGHQDYYQQMSNQNLQAHVNQLRKSDLRLLQRLIDSLLAAGIKIGVTKSIAVDAEQQSMPFVDEEELFAWFHRNKNLRFLSQSEREIIRKFNAVVALDNSHVVSYALKNSASQPSMTLIASLTLAALCWTMSA